MSRHTLKNGPQSNLPYSESAISEFFSRLSPSFAARLPDALYQETLVDQIKPPTQHTLIFATTLAYLPSYFIAPPQIFLLFPSHFTPLFSPAISFSLPHSEVYSSLCTFHTLSFPPHGAWRQRCTFLPFRQGDWPVIKFAMDIFAFG